MLQEGVKDKNIYLISFMVSFLSVLIAAWLGIFTRPLSHFAFFWPANAILLGLLISFPKFRNIAAFLGSLFAYLFADLSTGSSLFITLTLTLGNYISVGLTLILLLYLTKYFSYIRFSYYHYIYPYFISIFVATAVSSAFVVWVLPYIPDNFINVNSFLVSFINWWSAELFNYALILPILLSFPKNKIAYFTGYDWRLSKIIYLALPLLLIILSVLFATQIFSQIALLYPLVALVWAASIYRFFPLTLICSVVGLVLYHSLSNVSVYMASDVILHPIISIRIGVLIIILCVLVIGVMKNSRRTLGDEMNNFSDLALLNHDMNTQSFLKVCQILIKSKRQYPISFLKIEVDQLQKIHDQYGAQMVDQVLENCASVIRKKLRSKDILCRMERHEFIVLIQRLPISEVLGVAKRVQSDIKHLEIHIEEITHLNISVSLGISHCQSKEDTHLEQAIIYADKALHQAKMQGFNQINVHKNSEMAI